MVRFGCLVLCLALLTAGCVENNRAARWETTAVFTKPTAAAGASEYESPNMRVRLMPEWVQSELGYDVDDPLLVDVRIENKRSQLAHLDARSCCVVDAEFGANNLFLMDHILPGESFVRLAGRARSFIQINMTYPIWIYDSEPRAPRTGGRRLLLRIVWEDGVTESVDLSYEVEARLQESASKGRRG